MIWYSQQIRCLDHPPNILLELVGKYNHPQTIKDGQSIIEIIVKRIDAMDSSNVSKLCYSKNPSSFGMIEEYIDPELIRAKYIHIISRITRNVAKKKFTDLTFDNIS